MIYVKRYALHIFLGEGHKHNNRGWTKVVFHILDCLYFMFCSPHDSHGTPFLCAIKVYQVFSKKLNVILNYVNKLSAIMNYVSKFYFNFSSLLGSDKDHRNI